MSQTSLDSDFTRYEDATTECNTCGAQASIDPRLHEDGKLMEDGEVKLLEMKCENNHCFSVLVDHPDVDLDI
jgi:hypothetical protein